MRVTLKDEEGLRVIEGEPDDVLAVLEAMGEVMPVDGPVVADPCEGCIMAPVYCKGPAECKPVSFSITTEEALKRIEDHLVSDGLDGGQYPDWVAYHAIKKTIQMLTAERDRANAEANRLRLLRADVVGPRNPPKGPGDRPMA